MYGKVWYWSDRNTAVEELLFLSGANVLIMYSFHSVERQFMFFL